MLVSSIYFARSRHRGPVRQAQPCDLPPNAHALADSNPCTGPACGGNSPRINAFPINGLQAGCENGDREELEAGSLQRGASRCDVGGTSPLSLGFGSVAPGLPYSGFQLVAKRADGSVVCTESQLVGTTFQVDTSRGVLTLLIAHVGSSTVEGGLGPVRLAYQIMSAVDGETPMCDVRHHQVFGAGAGSVVLAGQTSTMSTVDAADNYAMIMPGPLYDHDGTLIPNSTDGWFNIACMEDALASSDAIVPTLSIGPQPAEVSLRSAAVHMFTAKYARGFSATLEGTPIAWQTSTGSNSPNYSPGQLVEAQWTTTGASCLSRSRLYMNNTVVPKLPDAYDVYPNYTTALPEAQFVAMFGLPACAPTPVRPLLTSYVVDHAP